MSDTPTSTHPRLGELGLVVHSRITGLQMTRNSASTTAMLAQLRSALGREPGDLSSIWGITLDGLPGGSGQTSTATPHEWASHIALTLYALHQQSRPRDMHRRGALFGGAIRRHYEDHSQTIRKRLDAMTTSSSFAETRFHLRGIVTLLRSADIPLDYGALADDLVEVQRAGRSAVVHRRWGRQFYHLQRADKPAQETPDVSAVDPTEETP